MSNESHFTGNQNIVIQNVTDSTIKIAIGDRNEEILLELASLKQLLAERNSQIIQIAGKIYNIEHINEANFGFILGKKIFNEALTKQLIEAIAPYSKSTYQFFTRASETNNWENQVRISDRAKEIIANSFVGPIGVQLRKLMAIGKEDSSEHKLFKYIEKCVHIARYSLELINYALISNLWDIQVGQALSLSTTELEKLSCRLDEPYEPSIAELFHLLQDLHALFQRPQFQESLLLSELADPDFAPQLQMGSLLANACAELQQLSDKCIDNHQYDLLDCYAAEKNLATVLSVFAFLTNYRMASIREIGFKQMRNCDPRYVHNFTTLGDSTSNVYTERLKFTSLAVHTDAVLLYRGDHYDQYINLSPFVIDYNALTFEEGTKICFYAYRPTNESVLNYVFLDDNSSIAIKPQGVFHLDDNRLMLPTDRRLLNLDIVIEQFKDANLCLLRNDSAFPN